MNCSHNVSFGRWWLIVPLLATVVWLGPSLSSAHAQGNPNPRILPPNSKPYGLSYGEWGAEWWKWAIGIPLEENPLLDETGESADVDQAGPVWFLAGNFGGATERTITVPVGKALFFPIINAAWWAPEDLEFAADVAESLGLDPDDLTDEELLRLLASFSIDSVTELSLSVNGVAMKDLTRYRAESPAFLIEDADLLEDFGYPPLDSRLAVADGYWIMLAPLPVGQHTIHFAGAVDNEILGEFGVDVTYNITVAPR
jgi:hypothetical protein